MEVLEAQNLRSQLFSRRFRLKRRILELIKPLNPIEKVHLDRYERPSYAYGVYLACMQAKMLGHDVTSVIEFGVAGGNGLLALESCAAEIGGALGIKVDVIGFDVGTGMPTSDEAKDMVYWYRPTMFSMDYAKLRARIGSAKLHIGMISETVVDAARGLRGPIGFCSFDMDYYTATMNALRIFDQDPGTRLPRVAIYADDVFGYHDLNMVGCCVGEECAFEEFNGSHKTMKISPIRGLRFKRVISAMWNDKMYALHDLTHPDYNTPINPNPPEVSTKLNALR